MFSWSVQPSAWVYREYQHIFTVQPAAKLIEESAGARWGIHYRQHAGFS
jgi:hypothetical protein